MTENQDADLITIADDFYYSAEYAKAIEAYEKIVAHDPTNQRAYNQLAKAKLILLTEKEKKIVSNDEKEKISVPSDAVKYLRRARSMVNSGSLETAIELLRNAIEVAHKAGVSFPQAENLLSSLYDGLKKLKKPKVFISYTRRDVSFATDIYWYLQNNGCNPWMDIYNLIPGQNWELEIDHNIKTADFFIACLSSNSVSKRGYIQKELKEALSILEQIPEGEIYLIPIRIDDCMVPSTFASRQWLDWSATNSKTTLLKAVKSKK
jgi:tetratricopeptide (TPR) repeat protein